MLSSNKPTQTLQASTAVLGSAYLASKSVRSAREIFFLGLNYSAKEAFDMGMV